MIRFFDSNYTPQQIQELRILTADALGRLQLECTCEEGYNANICDECPYRELCADLYRLVRYLYKLELATKSGKKVGEK